MVIIQVFHHLVNKNDQVLKLLIHITEVPITKRMLTNNMILLTVKYTYIIITLQVMRVIIYKIVIFLEYKV